MKQFPASDKKKHRIDGGECKPARRYLGFFSICASFRQTCSFWSKFESAKESEVPRDGEDQGSNQKPRPDAPTASAAATALPSCPRSRSEDLLSLSATAKLANRAEVLLLRIADRRRTAGRKGRMGAWINCSGEKKNGNREKWRPDSRVVAEP